jgi:hypothetical protein
LAASSTFFFAVLAAGFFSVAEATSSVAFGAAFLERRVVLVFTSAFA